MIMVCSSLVHRALMFQLIKTKTETKNPMKTRRYRWAAGALTLTPTLTLTLTFQNLIISWYRTGGHLKDKIWWPRPRTCLALVLASKWPRLGLGFEQVWPWPWPRRGLVLASAWSVGNEEIRFTQFLARCYSPQALEPTTCFTNPTPVVSFFFPDCLHGLLPGPFLLSYSVYVSSFTYVFVLVPCARLSKLAISWAFQNK